MIAQFKYEVRQFIFGLKMFHENYKMRIKLKYSIVKAVIIWKVRRLVVGIRTWSVWCVRKREKRNMLLSARGCGEENIKKRACRLWLTAAATTIQHDSVVRTRLIAVRAAKKWRCFVILIERTVDLCFLNRFLYTKHLHFLAARTAINLVRTIESCCIVVAAAVNHSLHALFLIFS